jgi:hypothetical protein
MRRLYYLLICSLFIVPASAQNIMIAKNATISFFSETPIENIEASSKTASSALDAKTGDLIFKVENTSFQFKKKLMQEHFNENYMESDKYPVSEFKGKITDPFDFSKPGTYTLNVSGTLKIHGVAKNYQTKAKFIVANGQINSSATFNVKVADHKIDVPTIVIKQIAEVMQVRINAIYQPKK